MISRFNRHLWRAAGRIRSVLEPPSVGPTLPRIHDDVVSMINRHVEFYIAANERQWVSAAEQLGRQLLSRLRRFQTQIQEVIDAIQTATAPRFIPTQVWAGVFRLPVEVDFRKPFKGSDWPAWKYEYALHVGSEEIFVSRWFGDFSMAQQDSQALNEGFASSEIADVHQ